MTNIALCGLQARSLADTKQAELNAKVLQLESHIHWLQQDNERLQDECNKQAASAAVSSDADQQGSADQGSLAQLQVSCILGLSSWPHRTFMRCLLKGLCRLVRPPYPIWIAQILYLCLAAAFRVF